MVDRLSSLLAENNISIFYLSTVNDDFILVRSASLIESPITYFKIESKDVPTVGKLFHVDL